MTKSRGIHAPRSSTLAERLAFHSEPGPDGCIVWTAWTDKKAGYGKLGWKGSMRSAHRLAWELANGPIPDGLEIRHDCDNPPCINTAHLRLGTHRDNIADMFARGRASRRDGESNNSARLTPEEVREIRRLRAELGSTGKQLADMFHISRSQIYNIITNRHWKETT